MKWFNKSFIKIYALRVGKQRLLGRLLLWKSQEVCPNMIQSTPRSQYKYPYSDA